MNNFDDIDVDFTTDGDGDGWLTMAQENLASLSGAAWYDAEPPDEDLTQEESNALRAREMNQLSTQEREQVYFDLHGVAEVLEEDAAFVECKLTEFDEAIHRISGPHTAFQRAALMSPEYVENVDFRLKFLRGDRFDVEVAAKRFIAYFEHKLELLHLTVNLKKKYSDLYIFIHNFLTFSTELLFFLFFFPHSVPLFLPTRFES